MTTTVYRNATVFIGDGRPAPAQALAVTDGRLVAVGEDRTVAAIAGEGARDVDLGGAFVTPGITESHAHMLMLGEALDKVGLRDCGSVAEVQDRLRSAYARNPQTPRIQGVSWRFDIFAPGQRPTAAMLDAVVDDVPVILDANDLHSAWVNSAALEAMGITDDTPNPVGGEIVRDDEGHATGFLLETAAVQYAWAYAEAVAGETDRDRYLDNAFSAYLRTGVTAATDMAFGPGDLSVFIRRLERDGRLPFPVTAHWMLTATGDRTADLAQVAEVLRAREEIARRWGEKWLSIVGVKFILDGVIDACTAAMRDPYANGEAPGPIWEREFALPIAVACDAEGLQLAMHAIGDEASTIALDMVEACVQVNGPRSSRRPRVEHLEYVADDTIARMAALGVTASMQPVHCDPAILDNWKAQLGEPRSEAGFPWHKFRAAGVPIALGTDAPTAPHESFDNLFIATTARSVLEPARDAYRPERVFSPAEALEALTFGGARATGREHEFGSLQAGHRANLVVWDFDPRCTEPAQLIGADAALTLVDGEVAHRRA